MPYYACTSYDIVKNHTAHIYIYVLHIQCGEPPHHTCTLHHTVVSHASSHMYLTSHCGKPYLITNDQPHGAPVQDSGMQTEGLVGYDQHRIADPPSLLSHEVTWGDDNEHNKSHFIPAGREVTWGDDNEHNKSPFEVSSVNPFVPKGCSV